MAAAWVTPALVAAILGWEGIWGAGSALTDYLIPLPVAGGALHVPSFVVATLGVWVYSGLTPGAAATVRGLFVALVLLGVFMLVDLERVYLAATTDLSVQRIPWQDNPLGLFVLCDALWALVCMLGAPALRTSVVRAGFASLSLPLLYVALAVGTNDRLTQDLVTGRSEHRSQRGDEVMWVYTRLSMRDASFRQAALAHVASHRPQLSVNVEDVAVFFTDSLDTAKGIGDAPTLATLCLYEDGTPDRWQGGEADCFSDHETFSDRVQKTRAAISSDTPWNVANFLVTRTLCTGNQSAEGDGLAQVSFCRGVDLAAMHEALVREYGGATLAAWLDRAG